MDTLGRRCLSGLPAQCVHAQAQVDILAVFISIEPGQLYRGVVYYLFPGGCVTYRLDFRSDEQARPLGEVSLALGFVTRDALRQTVEDYTDGRVPLDPPPGSGS